MVETIDLRRLFPSYPEDASIIVSAEDRAEAEKIRELLRSKGYENIFPVDDNLYLTIT